MFECKTTLELVKFTRYSRKIDKLCEIQSWSNFAKYNHDDQIQMFAKFDIFCFFVFFCRFLGFLHRNRLLISSQLISQTNESLTECLDLKSLK